MKKQKCNTLFQIPHFITSFCKGENIQTYLPGAWDTCILFLITTGHKISALFQFCMFL